MNLIFSCPTLRSPTAAGNGHWRRIQRLINSDLPNRQCGAAVLVKHLVRRYEVSVHFHMPFANCQTKYAAAKQVPMTIKRFENKTAVASSWYILEGPAPNSRS